MYSDDHGGRGRDQSFHSNVLTLGGDEVAQLDIGEFVPEVSLMTTLTSRQCLRHGYTMNDAEHVCCECDRLVIHRLCRLMLTLVHARQIVERQLFGLQHVQPIVSQVLCP